LAALKFMAGQSMRFDDEEDNHMFDSDAQSLSLDASHLTQEFEKLPSAEAASTKGRAAIRNQSYTLGRIYEAQA